MSIKGIKYPVICCLFYLSSIIPMQAIEPYYKNIGFELGNFSNWKGYTWIFDTYPGSVSTPKIDGIIHGRQTIISDTTAFDMKTGGKLKKVPPGYHYSARLGDAVLGALFESLTYTFKVDSTNAFLVWKFAVVLQDPLANHLKFEEPRFGVTLFDQNGDTIPDCANYDVHVSDAKISGFQINYKDTLPVVWRDWTTVGANLSSFLGKTITIEFMAGDCSRQGHYGYAYFVAATQPMSINVKYCTSDSVATLTAPEGFEYYSWKNSNGYILGNSRIIQIKKTDAGDILSCEMTSATGCTVKLHTNIVKYEEPKVDFISSFIDCQSNAVKFTNQSMATEGNLTYKWDFGDGNTSTLENPNHVFAHSGMHQVSLEVFNSAHSCSSILSKSVESFSPHMIVILSDSVYCPLEPTLLKAFGADHYLWSDGSRSDSLIVRNFGGTARVWVLGYSSTGCVSDTIYHTIYATPDWPFSVESRTHFCTGGNTVLTAQGAEKYSWNTGETSNSITVSSPGIYTVKGFNTHNCEESVSINVTEDSLPNVDFTLSNATIDCHHNEIVCSITPQPGVIYDWEMGDGSFDRGSTINHRYQVSNSVLEYPITLKATNENGCTKSVVKPVDIVLFVPNVFSPNGDGVNDLFMKGVGLQVFDRYGLEMYKGSDGWDGTHNGKRMDQDSYFYVIQYTDKNQVKQTLKGVVTLMK